MNNRCFRGLLLLTDSHLLVSKPFMSDIATVGIAEVKFVGNIQPS
jgi:hypothetical protein